MSWRPGKKAGPTQYAGDEDIRGGFRSHLIGFIDGLRAQNYSEYTLKGLRINMGYFIVWCEERGMRRPEEVTRAALEHYRQYIFNYRRKDNSEPLSLISQTYRLSAVRTFFRWMTRQHHLLYNPASELDLPRKRKGLPRHVLTVAEMEQVINAPNIRDASGLGVRDRAMLEALYSTGMRRAELVGLRIDDIDLARGTIFIQQGKGKKDRIVPIGARALAWIEKYRYEVRPRYLDGEESGMLFLARHGDAMTGKQLSGIVKKAIDHAALERFAKTPPNAACHLFRHACATHMLEGGADIRFIQALLGHEDMSTTQIYTRVSIGKLKEVHDATHPARLEKKTQTKEAEEDREENAGSGERESDWKRVREREDSRV
jgi:integrase/recombinase XerD